MKILTVFTGGTIACSSRNGVLSPEKGNGFLLLDMYKKTDSETGFETAFPYNILSENLCADYLNRLFDCLSGYDLADYDGVIVAHGTDTLQYTGAFLSLRLGLCDTPVVLVSANYPLADSRSNGFENFCAAVGFIRSKQGRGVFISYKNAGDDFVNIHRASRALPHKPYSDDLESLFNQPYGKVENGTFTKNSDYSETAAEFEVIGGAFGKNVLYIRPYPGIIYPDNLERYKAVLLEGYHSGTIGTDSREISGFCENARKNGVPVYLVGAEKGFNYESKQEFDRLGIKVLPPISPITAYMKLCTAATPTEIFNFQLSIYDLL